jgi:hypothetical protein
MVELIALIIFVLSFGGICFILARKMPVLVQLPEVQEGVQKENIFSVLIKKIKNISPDKIILLKTLSKVRVYILKAEKYIDNHLQGARKRIVKKQEEAKIEEKNNPPAGGPPTTPG